MTYLIYGSIEGKGNNAEVFYICTNNKSAQAVFEDLERLSDLSYPTTLSLRKEQLHLRRKLEHLGIKVNERESETGPQFWAEEFSVHLVEVNEVKK
jgi:hypothetical protein